MRIGEDLERRKSMGKERKKRDIEGGEREKGEKDGGREGKEIRIREGMVVKAFNPSTQEAFK